MNLSTCTGHLLGKWLNCKDLDVPALDCNALAPQPAGRGAVKGGGVVVVPDFLFVVGVWSAIERYHNDAAQALLLALALHALGEGDEQVDVCATVVGKSFNVKILCAGAFRMEEEGVAFASAGTEPVECATCIQNSLLRAKALASAPMRSMVLRSSILDDTETRFCHLENHSRKRQLRCDTVVQSKPNPLTGTAAQAARQHS